MRSLVLCAALATSLLAIGVHPAQAALFKKAAPAAQKAAATGQATVAKRTLGQRLKAGWRKIGIVGQGAVVLGVTGAAAFGMHQLGMSPTETAAVLGGTGAIGATGLAVVAQRAKRLWTGSLAALKLKKIDDAREAGSLGDVSQLISDIKQAAAINAAQGTGDQKAQKTQTREAAFLGLSLARAELALDDSKHPDQRTSGATLQHWQSHLGTIDQQATSHVTPTSEGKLALELKKLEAETHKTQGIADGHGEAIARFEDHVPIAFGGQMAREAKATKAMLQKLRDDEIGGERTLHSSLTGKMRGRISDRLSGERTDFKQRRVRHGELQKLRQGKLGKAIAEAEHAESELAAAISDRQWESHYQAQALAHKNDVEHYTEDGQQKTRIVDNSHQYLTQASWYASSAQTHTSNANRSMSDLEGHLHALASDATMKQENLATPGKHGLGDAQRGPGWAEELFLPTAFNLFSNFSAQSSLSSAKGAVSRKLGALGQLHDEVSRREGDEQKWMDQQIDADLSRQMQAAR
jgi:hypothetical protein